LRSDAHDAWPGWEKLHSAKLLYSGVPSSPPSPTPGIDAVEKQFSHKEQKRGDVQPQPKQHLKLAKREGGRKILLPPGKARKTIALSHEAKK